MFPLSKVAVIYSKRKKLSTGSLKPRREFIEDIEGFFF